MLTFVQVDSKSNVNHPLSSLLTNNENPIELFNRVFSLDSKTLFLNFLKIDDIENAKNLEKNIKLINELVIILANSTRLIKDFDIKNQNHLQIINKLIELIDNTFNKHFPSHKAEIFQNILNVYLSSHKNLKNYLISLILSRIENSGENAYEFVTKFSEELILIINDYSENEEDNANLLKFYSDLYRVFSAINKLKILRNSNILQNSEKLLSGKSLPSGFVKLIFRLNFNYPFKIQLDSFKNHFSNAELNFEKTIVEGIEKLDISSLNSLNDTVKSSIEKELIFDSKIVLVFYKLNKIKEREIHFDNLNNILGVSIDDLEEISIEALSKNLFTLNISYEQNKISIKNLQSSEVSQERLNNLKVKIAHLRGMVSLLKTKIDI